MKSVVSGTLILTFILLSKTGQDQLAKFTPDLVSQPFTQFQYETGKTPFSEWYWPIGFCFTYLISIFVLKAFMRDRKPYDLHWFRMTHNWFLCFGSLVMLIGLVQETWKIGQKYGTDALVCDPHSRQSTDGRLYFWYYVFFLSKFYEFIDTFILILRKKPTTFLHCFHHFITAFLCWIGLYTNMSVQWVVVIPNSTVHVFMYYYYFAQTLGYDVWWKVYLTSAQIVQFVFDIMGISAWWYYYLYLGVKCTGDPRALLFSYIVLTSFLVLFLNFYRHTYTPEKQQTKKAQ